MTGTEVYLQLDGRRMVFQPGETLAGEYHLESLSFAEPSAVELSVVWHTAGQGDEDLAVHYFERLDRDQRPELDLRRPQRFSVALPRSPLSYDGVIVKIRWCVRVRVYLTRGKELFAEAPFQLGAVPPGRVIEE